MIRKAILVLLTFGAAGTAAIWVLSYTTIGKSLFADSIPTRSYDFRLTCPRAGSIVVMSCRFGTMNQLNSIPTLIRISYGGDWYERLGFERVTWISRGPNPPEVIYSKRFMFPAWVPFIVFGTYPTVAFMRGPLRRWRRRRKGLCVKCRYDLTANVTGTCPECGTPT